MGAIQQGRSKISLAISYFWLTLGALAAAFAIRVFLIPNGLIDGGVVGVAMILGWLLGPQHIWFFYIVINLPFVYLAYRFVGTSLVVNLFIASILFSLFLAIDLPPLLWAFKGDPLEVVVIGGAILGTGLGLVIRNGGCMDGTEILGIIFNRRYGVTVGQTVLVCNIFVFSALGLVTGDWHPPLLSLILYVVALKVMDSVIVGLDEMKSVMIISGHSKLLGKAIVHELGLGLTVMYGRGGFSGDEREILYVIVERLQLSELKEIVQRVDPSAFMAIEDLHEVSYGGGGGKRPMHKSHIEKLIAPILSHESR
ncbi:MAG: YitT family protein [Chlamydiia bacterium]|nr:YitT family protein [Chlamydiia bacterium]